MVLLTELPPEILHNVLIHVDPPDLAWLPRVCKAFYHVISQNVSLFKELYLQNLDTPPADHELDWERAIKDLVRLQVVCRRTSVEDKKGELSFVYDTVTSLLKNAVQNGGDRASQRATHTQSRNAELLETIFRDETNQAAFLCRSFIYERARGELKYWTFSSPPRAEHQQSAHLHCLYGVPLLYAHPEAHRTRASKMSPFACSKVYDLRQYTQGTMWGPFMDDGGSGRVDWEKVEAIMIVLGANLKQLGLDKFPICRNVWDMPFPGVWPHSYKPLSSSSSAIPQPATAEVGDEALDLEDPYGVAGTWLRVVCFLDYTDFFGYNFNAENQPPPNVPRPAIDVGEATRLIIMKLWVTAIEPPGPEDGQELPVVHFKGISRSLDDSWDDNADSDLRGMMRVKGTVRLTREGEVRWTSFSVFAGHERWRSESIQIGGVKSAKGVLGNWFDKDFDPRGPAGPTAFWKVSDRSHKDDRDRVIIDDFVTTIDTGVEEDEDEDDDWQPSSHNDGVEDEDGDSQMETEIEVSEIIFANWTDGFDT